MIVSQVTYSLIMHGLELAALACFGMAVRGRNREDAWKREHETA